MSLPALYLACQAAEHLAPPEEDEFGLSWADLGITPPLVVDWALYRSAGAGLVFGVRSVRQETFDEWLDSGVGL